MILHGWLKEQPVTLSLNRGVLTVAFDEGTVLAFDQVGRFLIFYAEGHHFHRSLNGNVLAKWIDKSIQQYRRLWRSEADLLVLRTCAMAQHLRDELVLEADPELLVELTPILDRAAAFDVVTARADVNRYNRVYEPIGIFPPDQRMALVVQMTEGCPFETCAFCDFYQDRPFHVKSPRELRAHVKAIHTYLGDLVRMHQGIFIADANALVAPQGQLLELFDIVDQRFGKTQISTFLDGFSPQAKMAGDYAALAERGLDRVYVNLESGHDPLLAWLRKSGQAADAVATVQQIKAGQVSVGVVVMLGIGGQRYAEGHVADTIEAVNLMGLGQGDTLYLTEFMPLEAFRTVSSDAPDLQPLPRSQMQAQREAIVAGLHFGDERPQIATCDISEFVY
jgi:hypothetical protein